MISGTELSPAFIVESMHIFRNNSYRIFYGREVYILSSSCLYTSLICLELLDLTNKEAKKMRKTAFFGMLALMVIGIFFSASMVSAYMGDYSVKGLDFNEERHDAMEQAFDKLDYEAWSQLMTETGRTPRVMTVVTESNFETFVRAHEAGENGDYEAAAALRAELGLNNGNGPKDGTGFGNGMGQGKGQGQKMQQTNFVDADNDGACDSLGSNQGKGRR
ncbi:MAG: hypothetical protein ABIC95_00170 [archaeon]